MRERWYRWRLHRRLLKQWKQMTCDPISCPPEVEVKMVECTCCEQDAPHE